MSEVTKGFILSRHWKDTSSGILLSYWLHTENGPVIAEIPDTEAVFFVEHQHMEEALELAGRRLAHYRKLQLQSFNYKPVIGFYFSSMHNLRQTVEILNRHNICALEADIRPPDRYLMERFINASVEVHHLHEPEPNRTSYRLLSKASIKPTTFTPDFQLISFDIETSITEPTVYSIAVYSADCQQVFMLSDIPVSNAIVFGSERKLIQGFIEFVQHYDPDILIGWNCINFDLRFLQERCKALGIEFAIGRDKKKLQWRTSPQNKSHFFVTVPGRAVIDGIDTLKMATYHFESYALDNVANELLGERKLIDHTQDKGEEITRLFHEDKPALARYNLSDCELVWKIFEHSKLIQFCTERSELTGLPLDKVGGSVAAFENQYLPRLHRKGFVAPNLQKNPEGVGSPGGYVMNSDPGLYKNVLVLDFKSLYPSIIRTFNVDPYSLITGLARFEQKKPSETETASLIPGFNGAYFLKHDTILPDLIDQLWKARDVAKSDGNLPMSHAIKIIMNSFYGVLGTPGCRFFNPMLPSSITLRGHEIMTKTKELIEAKNYKVIYGDTDSIFVHVDQNVTLDEADQIGIGLVQYINFWWKDYLQVEYHIDSALELEYETHYSKFLMPTIRGSEIGTKKRYAGLVYSRSNDHESELIFKGLETVRSDWTLAARQFQKQLYQLIFDEQPYEEFIKKTVTDIMAGKRDTSLHFRKRIRRKLAEYTSKHPPHVKAAILADAARQNRGAPAKYQNGGWIEYVYTLNGPEAVECQHSLIDYPLYIERQIKPIVDGIVNFAGTSFDEIMDQQIPLI